MSLFDADPRREAAFAERARTRPATMDDLMAGPLEGLLLSPIRGMASAFDHSALAAAELATPGLQRTTRSLDELFGTDATGYLDQQRAMLRAKVDANRPSALTTGYAAGFVEDLFRIGGEAGLGYALGGPVGAFALAGGAEGVGGYRRGLAQGLDPATAEKVGAVEGLTAGAGVVIPMAGPTLKASLALGVGGNVGMGGAQRFATHEVLARAGYPEQAAQQRVFDGTAILVDAVLGTVFGAGGYALTRSPTPAHVDAALALGESMHVERTAPGLPADPGSAAEYARAFDQAAAQILRDEPVTAQADAKFVRDPEREAERSTAAQALADVLPAEVKRSRSIVDPERDSITTAIAKLGGLDLDQARSEWGATVTDDRIRLNSAAWAEGGPFGRPVLRKGGRLIDDMAHALAEQGYLRVDEHGKVADLNELADRLQAEAGGARQYTPQGEIRAHERRLAEDQREIDDEAAAERAAIQAESLPDELADVKIPDADGNEVRAADAYTMLERARRDSEMEKRLLQAAANCEAAFG